MKATLAVLAVLGLGLGLYFYASHDKKKENKQQTVTVNASRVVQRDTLVEIEAIGTAHPFSTINIKSLVDGQLKSVGFTQGKLVTKDQVLFIIDPRPFEVQLQQVKATLTRDEAQLENAIKILERGKTLRTEKNMSQQEYDQLETNVAVLKGSVEVDKAAVANAQLQLDYCTIRSPVTGYAGNLRFDVGNIIQAKSETPLITINQVIPIYVNFAVPEQYLPYIKNNIINKLLDVSIFPKDTDKTITGTLSFIDNTVDVTTGTIQLKATVSNENYDLWPGEFVNIKLPLRNIKNALVIPSRAIQAGPNGFFAFTIDSQNKVVIRNITVGPIINDETIVLKGLQEGEIVITEGHLKLTQGSVVKYNLINGKNTSSPAPEKVPAFQ